METQRSAGILIASVLGVTAFVAMDSIFLPSDAPGAPKETGLPAPVWELKDVEGRLVKSTDYAGKVLIVDFWATWCGPCRAEIPGFIDLQKKYGEQGLVVVGISLDEEGPSVVRPFMRSFGINYPIVMGDSRVADAFGGIVGLPTTFIINRAGQIVHKHVGYADKSQFEKEILPLLKHENKT